TVVPLGDSQGVGHSVGFTRPTEVDIYLDVYIVADADTYAGDTAVKEALANWGDENLSTTPGAGVIHSRLIAVAFVEGVLDVEAITIGDAPSPTGEVTWPIDAREIADLDTSRITVVVTLV